MSELQSDLSIGGGWQHATLGKLLPLKYGKSLPAQLRDPHGTQPVYGSSGMVGTHSAALTNGPTLIVGRKGNVGAIHYSAVPCWPIDTAYFVETPAGHNLRYYKYLLESLNLVKLDRSTAIPGLSRDDYNAVQVSVAPPEKQDEIVAELEKQFSRLDEAVANLQRVKANLKRYKASVLKNAVEGRIGLQGTMDFDSSENVTNLRERLSSERRKVWQERIGLFKASRYKEPLPPSNSGRRALPLGWTWATLDELSRGDRPCAYGVLQPGDNLAEGVPFVRVGDINEGAVALGQLKRIDPAIAAQYPRTRLEGGEFLITLVGSIGRTAIVQPELAGANVARAVGVVPLTPLVNPRWVEIWFRSPDQLRLMNGQAHEVARKTLNLEDVRNALVALPPLLEQGRIVGEVDARLSILDSLARDAEKSLLKATQLRSAVLQKSFGELISESNQ